MGRYVVERVLGRGGMGTVYSVVDGTDGRRRALKVVHSAVMEGPEGLDRFRREVELPSGDVVREEDPEVEGFALVLESPSEKTGWESGMALVFEGRHYRLSDFLAPSRTVDPWTYRFVSWPEEDVLRLVFDYDADCVARIRKAEGSLLGRLKRLLPGGPDRPLR